MQDSVGRFAEFAFGLFGVFDKFIVKVIRKRIKVRNVVDFIHKENLDMLRIFLSI